MALGKDTVGFKVAIEGFQVTMVGLGVGAAVTMTNK